MSFLKPWKRFRRRYYYFRRAYIPVWTTPVVVIALAIGSGIMGFRQLGMLEKWELSAYDQMVRLKPPVPEDDRLAIVTITGQDIKDYNQDDLPLSDKVVYDLLTKIEQHSPQVIGLDIFRHIPQPPGNQELTNLLKTSDRIVNICFTADEYEDENGDPGLPPPPGVPEERVGFADLVVDPGGIIRRGLLFIEPPSNSKCQSRSSLSFQLALKYLENLGIAPQTTPEGHVKLGKAVFKRLSVNSGGYQTLDSKGFQTVLNYRSSEASASTITLDELFTGDFPPNLIKDKIVLVGVTAKVGGDLKYTPYSAGLKDNQQMAGVVIHGQLTSQIISAALGETTLFRFIPEWGELLWILICSLGGGLIAYSVRHPLALVITESAALGGVIITTGILFLNGVWLPVIAPSLTLLLCGVTSVAYRAYHTNREKQEMVRLVEEQKRNIESLQILIKDQQDNTHTATTTPLHTAPTDAQTELPPDGEDDDEEATAIAPEGDWQTEYSLLAGRYRITEVLGAGGFGSTYLAEDTHLPSAPSCVVKRLQTASKNERYLKIAKRLFETEAKILGKLGHHPQIPRLLAHFEENQEFYLVQEYIPGQLLSDELRQSQGFGEQQVIEFLQDVLSTLAYVHSQLVIHRDLKPSNLIRSQNNGRWVLIDFGAVKQIQPQDKAGEVRKTVAIGTKGYTPPEQFAGHPNFSSDIYALGMITLQALTGTSPHQIELEAATGNFKLDRYLEGLEPKLAVILTKMVRYHFQERYSSAQAVLEDLKNI